MRSGAVRERVSFRLWLLSTTNCADRIFYAHLPPRYVFGNGVPSDNGIMQIRLETPMVVCMIYFGITECERYIFIFESLHFLVTVPLVTIYLIGWKLIASILGEIYIYELSKEGRILKIYIYKYGIIVIWGKIWNDNWRGWRDSTN